MSINERAVRIGVDVGRVDPEAHHEMEEEAQDIGLIMLLVASESLKDERGPLVWTIVENVQKDATDRLPGQISVPAETRKEGEKRLDTLLGAIAEVTDHDEDLDYFQILQNGFFPGAVLVKGKPASVAILLYDGPLDVDMHPVDSGETTPKGWMRLGEVARLNGEVRPLAHDAFSLSRDMDLDSLTSPENRYALRKLLGPGFSISTFVEERERHQDVVLD